MSRKLERLVRIRTRQRTMAVAGRAVVEQRIASLRGDMDALTDSLERLTEASTSVGVVENLAQSLHTVDLLIERATIELRQHDAKVARATIEESRAETLRDSDRAAREREHARAEQRRTDDLRPRSRP